MRTVRTNSDRDRRVRGRPSPGERGFTLLELVVSMAVFMIGFAGLIGLQTSSIKFNRLSSDISLASNLAANEMETLRVTNFSDIVDSEKIYDKFARELDPATEAAQTRFTLTTTVTEPLDTSYLDINVQVRFTYAEATTKTVSMRSRILR